MSDYGIPIEDQIFWDEQARRAEREDERRAVWQNENRIPAWIRKPRYRTEEQERMAEHQNDLLER